MELLLDYQYDKSNGMNLIESFSQYNQNVVGGPAFSNDYLIVPVKTTSGTWKLLSYTLFANNLGPHQTIAYSDQETNNTIHTAVSQGTLSSNPAELSYVDPRSSVGLD